MSVVAVGLMLSLMLAVAARAHSWYPAECCSGEDCTPVDKSRVKVVEGGYALDGVVIPQAIVRKSLDGEFHVCIPPTTRVMRCFFAPVPNS